MLKITGSIKIVLFFKQDYFLFSTIFNYLKTPKLKQWIYFDHLPYFLRGCLIFLISQSQISIEKPPTPKRIPTNLATAPRKGIA